MFDFFRLARYRVTIAAGQHGLILPSHKGATFRGGFGAVFRRIACALREQECGPCILRNQCPYAYIFETAPQPGTQALSKYESIPRPFVLEPPLDSKTVYAPGEKLDFQLLLIGRAIRYFPYFIVVFREMAAAGLGSGRRPFIFEEVTALGLEQATPVYTCSTNTVRATDLSYSGAQLTAKTFTQAKKIRVAFETPVRLVDDGRLPPAPEFHIFFRHALRRISAMAYFHHGQPLEADYVGLTERSRQVALVANNTHRQDWERYSRRQNQRVNMGGLIGEATYQGNLDEFLPWLALGGQIHIGKNTVFGLGKYSLTVL